MAERNTGAGLRLVGAGGDDRGRPGDIDRHVAARVRERRIALGLTQHQLAELIGVTTQQTAKYEAAVNRISAGRLFAVAGALGVEVAHFYKGVAGAPPEQQPQGRRLLELARDFAAIGGPRRREALSNLARVLAGEPPVTDGGRPGAEG